MCLFYVLGQTYFIWAKLFMFSELGLCLLTLLAFIISPFN